MATQAMTKEGLQAVREALKVLSKVKDDLPVRAKRAMGILASMIGYGAIEEELAQEDIDSLYKSFLALQSVNKDQEARKVVLSADVTAALKKVIAILGKLLSGYGYKPKEDYYYYASLRPRVELIESAEFTEAVEGKEGLDWKIQFIQAGLSINHKFYPPRVLKDAVPLFEDVKVFADHPTKTEERERPERSVRDVVGWVDNVRYEGDEEGGLYGVFHALEAQKWFANLVKEAYERGKPNLVGFSIRAWGKDKLTRMNGNLVHSVEKISKVMSIDAVTEPAAGGKFVHLFESQEESEMAMIEDLTLEELQELRPDLVEALEARKRKKAEEEEEEAKKLTPEEYYKKYGKYPKPVAEAMEDLDAEAKGAFQQCMAEKMKGGMSMADAAKECKVEVKKAAEAKKKEDELTPEEYYKKYGKYPKGYKEAVSEEAERIKALEKHLARLESQTILNAKLSGVKLPAPSVARIKSQFEGKVFEESLLQEAIDAESRYISDLEGSFASAGPLRVEILSTERERIKLGIDGMLEGKALADPKTGEKVPPFTSLHEAYCRWTGKSPWDINARTLLSECAGFDSEIYRQTKLQEAIETASWAQILGDSITRKLLADYALPHLEEWRNIVSTIFPIKDFRTQRRVRMGGYGKLPTVGEGATYPDLTSPTDEEATYAVKKQGGLESLSIEAITNDDIGAVRRIPIELAKAAKQTLYEFVFDFLRTNAAVYDGVALTAVAHANITAAALSWAQMSVIKQLFREQVEYQTGRVLNLRPKWLIVPAELESIALRIRDSNFEFLAAQAAIGAANIHKGSFDVIVCGYWTDANNYWAVADPALNPTIELGFLNGREEPELFTESQGAGDYFTADKVVYKIRHIYGGAVVDYRTFVGGIVP